MRATIWSLATLTGAVLAAPGSDGWGSPAGYSSVSSVSTVSTSAEIKTSSISSSSTCTEEESHSASTSSTPAPQSYLSSTVVIPSYSSIISSSISIPTKYIVSSSSKVSVASASVPSKASSAGSSSLKSSISSVSSSKAKSTFTSTKKVESTVTVYTTIYTSVGTATTTKSNGGWTEISTYLTTDVKTSTVTSAIPVTPTKESSKPVDVTVVRTTKVYTTICPSGSASGSGSSSTAAPATTVTKYTSIFTTICPETATSVSGSATLTKTYDVTSKITSVYETTVTLTTSTLTYGTDTIPVTIPIPTSSIKYPPGYGSSSKSRASHSKQSSHSGSKASKASKASRTSTKTTLSATTSSTAVPSGTAPKSRPMPYGDDCVPCAGQPGSDPNAFCGYSVHDNSYEVTPITCVHKKYEFTLSNQTISPDGVERYGLVINGQVPGPQVEANWGDWISITLHNTLQNNGTSLHMHGFRQFYTNEMDGVASITQCPTAPGDSITYTFRADNYGTSWYHSHFSLQTYEGFFGPVVIHGPQTLAYDSEEMIVLSDWNHIPVDQMFDAAQFVGPPPANGPRILDTGLINGLNVFGADGDASQTGERFVLNVESGKKYLLRIVSSSIQATFKFYVDGHSFTVVSNDFVPIVPYTTNILNINIGQRYNVILEANQAPGNYWMRADNQETCGSITNGKNIKGVVRYQGAAEVIPTSTAYTYIEECVDEPLASLVPVVPLSVGAASETLDETIFIKAYDKDPSVYRWTLSDAFFQADYDTPSLGGVLTNGDVPYTGNLVIDAPKLGEWIYIIIDSVIPVPHPIHLHGHDFMVLAQGPGLYSSATTALNLVNPPRRDVALMPGSGHLVIAFITDNPGVWLLHCHIGWHSAMGFALQIVENLENIASTVVGADQIADTCSNWQTYAHADDIKVLDAGI